MAGSFYRHEAETDFERARTKEILNRIMGLLWPKKQELLSFEEVRSLLQPKAEAYQGLKVVPINKIVGSEGRYQDFNKQFLPRKEHLRHRWTRVDEARLQDIVLPPIKLYELGGAYFVRDGNHRVSVAKSQGVEAIDAEVTSLDAKIRILPNFSKEDLYNAVLDYEYANFLEKTHVKELFPEADLRLTCTGRYDEIMYHIFVHKYFINQDYEEELPFSEAVKSWYRNVYYPIHLIVEEENLLSRFPGKTEADLYVWIVKHWHFLKERYGEDISAKEAAVSYSQLYGKTWWIQLKERMKRFFRK